jgi:hypothetical protein
VSRKPIRPVNDAAYCRFRGWEAGTVLHLLEQTYRITAVGEEAILVRLVRGVGRSPAGVELKWVRTLVNQEIVSARPVEFRLRNERARR